MVSRCCCISNFCVARWSWGFGDPFPPPNPRPPPGVARDGSRVVFFMWFFFLMAAMQPMLVHSKRKKKKFLAGGMEDKEYEAKEMLDGILEICSISRKRRA